MEEFYVRGEGRVMGESVYVIFLHIIAVLLTRCFFTLRSRGIEICRPVSLYMYK